MIEKDCVHLYIHNGDYFVIDGNSGAVHVLDVLAYKIVEFILAGANFDTAEIVAEFGKIFGSEQVIEAYMELGSLVEQGLLFSSDLTEVPQKFDSVVKALCLNVAHDCNLRCKYCFAGTGNFGGKRELMTLEVAKKAIDFLIAGSGNRRQLEVDFFGGEPLLNFDVVRETVAYGNLQAEKHNKKFRFTLTTNGIGLTEEIQTFLNENMYNVVLSIDGRPEVNDAARKTINGNGSVHDVIVPKYQELVAKRDNGSYYVRGTFTKDNLDFTNDVLHLAELGFDQISMEPVVADPELDYALTEKELPIILDQYHRLADALVEKYQSNNSFNFFHFNVELKKGPCLYKRLAGCGAGHEYIAVTPDGKLYPCHQFVGEEGYIIGDVWQGITQPELGEQFKQAHVLNKTECRKCWAKYFCSGGCHANNIQYGGDLHTPFTLSCDMERKRLECSFFIFNKINS